MRLVELEPKFVRYETHIEDRQFVDGTKSVPVNYMIPCSFQESQGIDFLCPECFQKNGGSRGTHHVEVSFTNRGVADDQGSHGKDGKPTRWNVSGNAYENLTLTPSILIDGDDICKWHGFITNGQVR